MSRRVTLRKCSEHDNCQLQRVNDGDWEHTPARRSLEDRLSGRVSSEALKKELRQEIGRASYLKGLLEEIRGDYGTSLADLKAEAAGLPKVMDLWRKGEKLGEYLYSRLKVAEEALERLERALQRADTQAARQAAIQDRLEKAEERAKESRRQADEALAHATERLDRAEALLITLQERKSQLDRVDAVYDAVDELSNQLRVAIAAMQSSDRETRRQIEHERHERILAHEKTQRQIRTLAEDK